MSETEIIAMEDDFLQKDLERMIQRQCGKWKKYAEK